MAKLTRIVKKLLLKDAPDTAPRRHEPSAPPPVESVASRGLAQPTVDFSNLPVFDDDALARQTERARRKSLARVSHKGAGIAKDRDAAPRFRSGAGLPKVKGATRRAALAAETNTIATPPAAVALPAAEPAPRKPRSKAAAVTSGPSSRVIKSGSKSDSRGKRKRESRKDMWRRKYDFANEAHRIVEAFQKEDKYGKALGNLSGMKDELSSLEALLESATKAPAAPAKPTAKRLLRAKLRNKALLHAALSGV